MAESPSNRALSLAIIAPSISLPSDAAVKITKSLDESLAHRTFPTALALSTLKKTKRPSPASKRAVRPSPFLAAVLGENAFKPLRGARCGNAHGQEELSERGIDRADFIEAHLVDQLLENHGIFRK